MSGTVAREIELQDLIDRSEYIVHAKKASPFQTYKEDIKYNFVIIKIIAHHYPSHSVNSPPGYKAKLHASITAGDTISVKNPSGPTDIPEGKWAYEETYRPSTSLEKDDEFILFLLSDDKNYHFVVVDGYDSINKHKTIIDLMDKEK